MHPTALACTFILGLPVFGLGLAVSGLRFSEERLFAHPDDPHNLLHKVVRAHGNATEYAPFLAVLFLYVGAHGPSVAAVWLMAVATACRVLHAIGLVAGISLSRPNPFRFVGAFGTYTCGLALCVGLLWPF